MQHAAVYRLFGAPDVAGPRTRPLAPRLDLNPICVPRTRAGRSHGAKSAAGSGVRRRGSGGCGLCRGVWQPQARWGKGVGARAAAWLCGMQTLGIASCGELNAEHKQVLSSAVYVQVSLRFLSPKWFPLRTAFPAACFPLGPRQAPALLGMQDAQKGKQLRVLAFGDSITGGRAWGANADDARIQRRRVWTRSLQLATSCVQLSWVHQLQHEGQAGVPNASRCPVPMQF